MAAEGLIRAFHRHLWHRLPREARRELFFRTSALVAPRPSPSPSRDGPITVVGTFRAASGLGESARLCRDALLAIGRTVHAVDITDALMQPADAEAFSGHLDNIPAGKGTLILHVNGPLMPLALRALGRRHVRNKLVLGYWAWELPDLPDDWRFGFPFVHGVLAPSRFTANAIARATSLPVEVLPHPIAVRSVPAVRKAEEAGHFTVLTVFNAASSFARKNPEAAITAFRLAFGDDPTARLIMKLSNPGAFQAGTDNLRNLANTSGNITLIERVVAPDEMDRLYNEADVVLSLHRSEGFGLIVAEAMLRGIPTIATDWSGSTDFFNSAHGIPVPIRLIPAIDPQGTYHHPEMRWAEPDIGQAAAALRKLKGDRELRRQLGETARRDALQAFGVSRYVASLDKVLASP